LIHGATERQLWTNSYERDRRDVLALQSQVAQDIAQEIRIKVTPQEQARLAQVPSVNPDAFQLYSMGRYHWNKREEEDLKKAINYFAQAIAKDPNYALAYAGLADSYILGGGSLSLSEAMLKAKEAATKALGIDDTLAEAHTSLAVVNMLYDWSWPAAESEFHRAINLKPSYATAHHWYAEFLTAMGRHEEAFASIQQAQELDPHSLIISRDVGWHYYCAGLYDQAIKQCRNTLDLAPNFIEAQTLLGLAYVKKDMFAEAIAGLQKAVDLSQSGSNRAMLGYAYAMSGQREKAQQVLDALNKLSKESYVSPFFIAAIYGGLGDKDQAFVWLQKAYHERSGLLVYLKVVPMLDSLRSDPRFRNLAQRLGLPD
jgi:tetratricopeptide (TPR) repeat protein